MLHASQQRRKACSPVGSHLAMRHMPTAGSSRGVLHVMRPHGMPAASGSGVAELWGRQWTCLRRRQLRRALPGGLSCDLRTRYSHRSPFVAALKGSEARRSLVLFVHDQAAAMPGGLKSVTLPSVVALPNSKVP